LSLRSRMVLLRVPQDVVLEPGRLTRALVCCNDDSLGRGVLCPRHL
jgi:hypothetical protein